VNRYKIMTALLALVLVVSSLAGCARTEKIVEKEVEKVVTKEVEKQVVVTATPPPWAPSCRFRRYAWP